MKYVTKNKGDEDKVSQALQKMMAEDVTLKVVNDSENRQALLYGIGDQHLEIAVSKLLDRYKCEVTLETPKMCIRDRGINGVITNIIKIVMNVAPIGIFCLLANVAGTTGFKVIIPMLKFLLVLLIGDAIQFLSLIHI